ncbi:MAG: TlpA family protein disulfide reductase [Deltaproteobacteria bacterium]|nr:TlpA family protein disulfide reductase [Deltaproteobacteria bacterium]
MQRAYNQYKEKGLVVIGLGFQDTKSNLVKYAKDMKMGDMRLVFDTEGRIAARYGISYGAGTVFIDRKGIVTKRFVAGFGEKEFLNYLPALF